MTNEQAYEFFQVHEKKLRAYAAYHWRRRLASHSGTAAWEADDLYQETVTRALEKLHQFKDGNFLNWVGSIMTNLSISLLLRHELVDRNELALALQESEEVGADKQLDKAITLEALYVAIDSLSVGRGLSVLYALEKEDMYAVSRELGISATNARQYKFQAVQSLKKKLSRYK